jgi:hypothetical protein
VNGTCSMTGLVGDGGLKSNVLGVYFLMICPDQYNTIQQYNNLYCSVIVHGIIGQLYAIKATTNYWTNYKLLDNKHILYTWYRDSEYMLD